ncbi:MAG: hypothetical protein IPN91_08170 [Holophagaceae bacterium]|uniref:Uncharacterized protein n=1 Tax=Candidatus Geothrix odensensis TaxID=2954440 RepID=A0A936F2J3_9BACT|nr:hypothetical protein [Candidatus Geothrix odensensis]
MPRFRYDPLMKLGWEADAANVHGQPGLPRLADEPGPLRERWASSSRKLN